MSQVKASDAVPIEAPSPFELRVNLAAGIPENAVKEALATGNMGFLHSFTTGSAVDGPGVRVVAWTAGCQWRCLYCHNPDTWNMMNGIPVTIEHAKERLAMYQHGLKAMSGGLTLSGGEPLMQDRFAVKLFSVAKELDIHTALDTNGYLGERLTDEELEKVDLVLLDLKTFDPERHLHLTGKEVGPTHAFARRLGQRKKKIWVRYVLVPGLTDDEKDIEKTAQLAAELGTVERVDVLPFHQMGRYKWEKLGIPYTLDNTQTPSAELVERTCAQFKAVGLKAV
ncbi:MAG: pyruvate formate lyase-activating protein [Acidobacteria bacterium]|nr:MAG: pyruvate formate lyase-activating protein [Acidobacteriota bacterium]